nr:hypothetical protein [uncultured Blautia sp.]
MDDKSSNRFFDQLGMIIAILLFILCLCGCIKKNTEKISKGFDLKQLEEDCKNNGGNIVYAKDGILISHFEQGQSNSFYTYIDISPVEMSKESEKILTIGEPVSEYSVQLSDGKVYSHQNQGVVLPETNAWIHTYGSLQDIAESLQLNIVSSDLANYPESDNNLLLVYSKSPSSQRISIQSIIPKMEKNYSITDMDSYLCFGSAEDIATHVFTHITKEAKHKVYKIHGGEKAHLLYDLSTEQGVIFVRMDGAYYMWELQGIKKIEDLYEFADSLYII